MANWTKNIIISNGIRDLPIYTKEGRKKELDFNTIIPMPEELNVTKGSIEDEAVSYYMTKRGTDMDLSEDDYLMITRICSYDDNFIGSRDKKDKNWVEKQLNIVSSNIENGKYTEDEIYEKGKQYVENYKKYGSPTWYEWCAKNWGTYGNATNTVIKNDSVEFETPWDEPDEFLVALSKKFPDREFTHGYTYEDDPDGVYSGSGKVIEHANYVKYKNGTIALD